MGFALGVDVSRYQGKMHWPVCRAAGARFGYMRCTLLGSDNVLGTDWEWERNADLAPQSMDGTGAYHVIRPTKTGHEQADYFLEQYSKVKGQGYAFNLPVWLDAEANEAGVAPSTYANIAEEFCLEVIAAGYGIMPYTRAEWWNKNIAQKPLWSLLELCIARYTGLSMPWGNVDDPSWLTPRDWTNWRFWQHSADGNGRGLEFGAESDDIDIDYFNGDEAALLAYAGIQEPEPPSEKPMIDITSAQAAATGTAKAQLGPPSGKSWTLKAAHFYCDKPATWLRLSIVKDIPEQFTLHTYVFLAAEKDTTGARYLTWSGEQPVPPGYVVRGTATGSGDKSVSLNVMVEESAA